MLSDSGYAIELPAPRMTASLALRIERSEAAFMRARMEALRSQPENPLGVEVREFGSATGFLVRSRPKPYYNRVMGLTVRDIDFFPAVDEWFREEALPFRLDFCPGDTTAPALEWFARRGYYHAEFGAVFCSIPKPVAVPRRPGLEVHEIDPSEGKVFAAVYAEGFARPGGTQEALDNVAVEYEAPGWRRYLATVDGAPAGVACMHIADGVASLTSATTLPTYRGCGCQSALIAARISDAAADAELVVSQAWFGTGSFRNLQRGGLNLAYTKALWLAPKH